MARLFFPALFCWSRDLRHVEADFYPSLWVSGGAMLVRAETLVAVHRAKGRYLDPALFLYYDEAEFCWAARAEGYNVVVARKALAYHKGGRSGGGRLNSLFYYYQLPKQDSPCQNAATCLFETLVSLREFAVLPASRLGKRVSPRSQACASYSVWTVRRVPGQHGKMEVSRRRSKKAHGCLSEASSGAN